MDDLLMNCATGACCGAAAERAEAIAKAMMKDNLCATHDEALRHARWHVKHFDHAPAGTLQPFIKEIARLARA
jgi:hypothetical protein